jgi:hypothetical protein
MAFLEEKHETRVFCPSTLLIPHFRGISVSFSVQQDDEGQQVAMSFR